VRLSDPYWFQAFGCVLGFDWHSSGVTTTTCGAIKEGIKGLETDLGLFAAGGKGAASRKTPQEITDACETLSREPEPLVQASRLSAQPDKDALQLMERLPNLVLPHRHPVELGDVNPKYLRKILLKTYERAPTDFEGLLGVRGVGPKTLRSLALVAELIFGTRTSTRDPARFSFAHGGKDGTPYPVDRETYDRTIHVLREALGRAKVDRTDKVTALKRLAACGQSGPAA